MPLKTHTRPLAKQSAIQVSRRDVLSHSMAAGVSFLLGSSFTQANEPLESSDLKSSANALRDSEKLLAILAKFVYEAKKQNRIKAVVVSLNGETILAESFRGPAVDRAVNIKSVSKSVVATLLGVARQQSLVRSLDQTLGELAPELLPKGVDERVANLTLEDLVTMRAGLERTSGRAYGVWVNSSHWIHHVLSRPFVDEPGGRMLYSTGDTHVLGAVLSQLTGRTLYELANDWLGKPLGIRFAPWTRDPQGYYLGGNEMSLSPLHLVKLGELYIENGVIDGQKVLDANWVQDAFTQRTSSVYSGDGYGYGWFLRKMAGVPAAYARGYGGQVLHVIPSMSLSVVITSDETQRARSNGYMSVLHNLVATHLIAPLGSDQDKLLK
ncbi:MAG: beta-lactamase family protein [Gammaproteobacteria bacterium]|nr:beta-lactamase family protein [Gammaproteobacteria bacterium]